VAWWFDESGVTEEEQIPEVEKEEGKPAAEWFAIAFQGCANACAMSYGSPVYLVGSALEKPDPSDFDIRVPMAEADLARCFGKDQRQRGPDDLWPARRWKMAREQLKQCRRYSRIFSVNVDFQFQTLEQAAGRQDGSRLRLDKATDYDLKAGLGNT
jgi:hypothetical protein